MESQESQRQEQSQRGRKSASLLLLLILLVTVTVGFAVLSTTLNIKGESKLHGDWCNGPKCNPECKDAEDPNCGIITCPANENCDITDCTEHPDKCTCDTTAGTCEPDPIDCTTNPEKCTKPNCTVTATETCECTDPTTQNCRPNPQIWLDGDTIKFRHDLYVPGDVFVFNAKYENGGDIDAKVKNVNKSALNTTAQRFMTYDVTYADGSAIAQDDALNAGDHVNYKVTVTYKDSVTVAPTPAELDLINETAQGHYGATSSFSVTYEQK